MCIIMSTYIKKIINLKLEQNWIKTCQKNNTTFRWPFRCHCALQSQWRWQSHLRMPSSSKEPPAAALAQEIRASNKAQSSLSPQWPCWHGHWSAGGSACSQGEAAWRTSVQASSANLPSPVQKRTRCRWLLRRQGWLPPHPAEWTGWDHQSPRDPCWAWQCSGWGLCRC